MMFMIVDSGFWVLDSGLLVLLFLLISHSEQPRPFGRLRKRAVLLLSLRRRDM